MKEGSLKDHANSSSFSDRSRVNFLRSGGVGPWARGYSLTSRVSRGLGCRMKRGGYDLLVVVVVVTVLVSTHWDSSYWSFAARPDVSLSLSSKLTVSLWLALGRRISVVFWAGREPFAGGTIDMMTGREQGEPVGGDGMGMQAVDGRRSRCVGAAGVDVKMDGRSMSVLVPGTGLLRRIPANQVAYAAALALTRWTRRCCPSVHSLVCSGLQRVSRGPWWWAWEDGWLCRTRQVEGVTTESPSSNEAQALANMSFELWWCVMWCRGVEDQQTGVGMAK